MTERGETCFLKVMLAESYSFKVCVRGGRGQTIQEHLQSTSHQECLKAEYFEKPLAVEYSQTVPLVKMFSLQLQKLANKIGSEIKHIQ